MNIQKAFENLSSDMNDVNELADQLYTSNFEKFFKDMRDMYDKFSEASKSNKVPISDSELEWSLSGLPLQLFSVAEQLSKFKLNQEVVKLRIKELDSLAKQSKIDNPEIDEDKLIQSIYATVIARVESELSFSREFIMVLKKFWDSRRATEAVNPISESSVELPEYDPDVKSNKQPQHYIK